MRRPFLLLLVLAACNDPPPPRDAGPGEEAVILELIAPSPTLPGSVLEIRGLALDILGRSPTLVLERDGRPVATLAAVPGGREPRFFTFDESAANALGVGSHAIDVRAEGDGARSNAFAAELRVASELPVALTTAPSGEAHRNEVAVVSGDGMLAPSEGEVVARFVGTFRVDASGAVAPVDVALPVLPLERTDRSRGQVVLTTDIGGLAPGTFGGTVQLISTLRSGARSESTAVASSLHFNPPALYALDPTDASVGRVLNVRGAGFLGGSARPNEATILRLEGTFTPPGGAAERVGPMEIVPRFVSGAEVELLVEPGVRDDRVVAAMFGHTQGVFAGRATPITIRGTEELEGESTPFRFVLGRVVQVVFLRFLPGFYDSLSRFGLANAAPEIIARVKERIDGIYGEWNVDVRLEEPDDYSRTAYSVVEIGGPDPNGAGLFGYDNTPGKDRGNLRLFDAIGGANAETQMDGYPGYGGVFVESFLYWSSHPELPGMRPSGAPTPDPLFDEIFDPVRMRPATRSEVRGSGERAEIVARAVRALGSIIGETTSHEVGHSLGMAQPYGSPTAYHNDFDGEGCLMDAGGDRPLGERMALPGYTTTTLCYDQPSYMSEILGR